MAKLLVVMISMVMSLATTMLVFADPDMLQDVCVADLTSSVKVNGFPCKPTFVASDFFSKNLATPGKTDNLMGSNVTTANVNQIPGLNTLGVSMARIDYAPWGQNPPHTHPRATEIVFVLYGKLEVGFITTANVLVSQTIKAGDVFVFPKGLVHFQKNNESYPAAVIAAFNSQLQGTQSLAVTLFGSTPEVPNYVLAQAFQINAHQVRNIKRNLSPK